MAARSTFTRTSGSVITSAWANALRDHVVPFTGSDDVATEGQMAVNTTTDQIVVRTGTGAREIARYGALSAVTLTVTQSGGGITHAVTAGSGWSRSGAWIDVVFGLTFSSAGIVGGIINITVAGPPAPSANGVYGGFRYFDYGTALYVGSTEVTTGLLLGFNCDQTSNQLGATPSFGIAVTDSMNVFLRYPAP